MHYFRDMCSTARLAPPIEYRQYCDRYLGETDKWSQPPVIVTLLSFLNHNLHDCDPAQAVLSQSRNCDPSGVPYPTIARNCDTDLAVRRQEGKLDVFSTHTRPDEAACA